MSNLVRKTYEADATFVAPAGVTQVKVSLFQVNTGQIGSSPGGVTLIDSNGDAYGFGNALTGDGTANTRSSPVLVIGGKKWLQVSALGNNRVSAGGLTTDGDAYTWGQNNLGELGNNAGGAGINQSSPVLVVGGRKFRQFLVGGDTGVALQTNGLAVAWGLNDSGQLGDNTLNNRSSPVLVVGARIFKRIVAGGVNSYGITAAGDAYGWGDNSQGNLGDGTTANRSSPTLIIGGKVWKMIAAEGGSNFAGIDSNNDLYMCGGNSNGALGQGDTVNRSSPTIVPGGLKWRYCSCSSGGAWGITLDGTAYAWGGNNGSGPLGINAITARSTPTLVVGGYKFFQIPGIVSGTSSFLAIDGKAYTAGAAGGQGDNDNTINRSSPTLVVGGRTWNAKKETLLTSVNVPVTPSNSYAVTMFGGSMVYFGSTGLGNYYGLVKMIVEYRA